MMIAAAITTTATPTETPAMRGIVGELAAALTPAFDPVDGVNVDAETDETKLIQRIEVRYCLFRNNSL